MSLYDRESTYICPECEATMKGNWVNRHLVSRHGYRYWDNEHVMKPSPEQQRRMVEKARRIEDV